MPDELTSTAKFAIACELLLWLLGAALVWRVCLAPAARQRWSEPKALSPWSISLSDFALAAVCTLITALLFQTLVAQLGPRFAPGVAAEADSWLIVQSAGFQLGALLGVFAQSALRRSLARTLLFAAAPADPTLPPPPPEVAVAPPTPRPFRAGVVAFLIALPLIVLVSAVWKGLLEFSGRQAEPQEMIGIFNEASSPLVVATIVLLAGVVAPITEELIFRAGLFRYLRTRIPRWMAFVFPALLFASLHQSAFAFAPLFVLGLIFSAAYERTGRIAVSMVAHALFNLHTIVLLAAGVTG